MLGSNQNCTFQVGSIPASKNNIDETKTSYTSKLLCSSIVYPPQHATIIVKADIGASRSYWRTEDITCLTSIKDTHNRPTAQLPNNATMNAKKTGIITLSKSISTNAKKAHIFDSLHSESIIYLGKICGNDCITILDNIEINIIKYKTLILKVNRNKTYGLWDIPSSRLLRHRSHAIITKDNTKI